MILYHGSNASIEQPRLLATQRDLDFGKGFYLTSDFGQARSWARRSVRIRGKGQAIVSCYEADEDRLMDSLRVLRFSSADKEWLDFVTTNRRGTVVESKWDIVIGPVANDQTFPTLLLYMDGVLDADSTIRQLLPQKLRDQFTFKTEKALSFLKFIEAREV